MKYLAKDTQSNRLPSHPARGAWIEICGLDILLLSPITSHPARGAWIEIGNVRQKLRQAESHPARGAWIEMGIADGSGRCCGVAPRTGCVD